MNEYRKQAEDFLTKHNANVTIKFVECAKYFEDDKQVRNIYEFTITRGEKSYAGKFGDSIHNTEKLAFWKEQLNRRINSSAKCKKEIEEHIPNVYDILAAVQKYETPSDTWEFANEFGYEINSRADFRKVDKICEACEKEYKAIYNLFSDCMDELQEIN